MNKLNENTTISSVGGSFEVPLMGVSKRVFNSRIMYPKRKNSPGGKIVTPPQGYLKESEGYKSPEFLYKTDGTKVTQKDINEWFDVDKTVKPSWNGGKLIQIKSKCQSFPYCSQGAIDHPVKLIGESKEHMCESCYEQICEIANISKKTPEYIAEIIRKEYLSYEY
jgi:hypothetical protein